MKHNRGWTRKCHSLSDYFPPIYLIWQLWDEQACLGLAVEGGACGLPRSATPLIAPLTQHSIAGSSLLPHSYNPWWGYHFNSLFFWSFLTNSRYPDVKTSYGWLSRWKNRNKMTKPTSYHFPLLSITAWLSLGPQVNLSFLFQSEYSWKPVNGLIPNIVKSLGAHKIEFANKKITSHP